MLPSRNGLCRRAGRVARLARLGRHMDVLIVVRTQRRDGAGVDVRAAVSVPRDALVHPRPPKFCLKCPLLRLPLIPHLLNNIFHASSTGQMPLLGLRMISRLQWW